MMHMLNAERTVSPDARMQTSSWWRAIRVWEHPLWSALLAMVVYTGFAAYKGPLWQASMYAYFNYLADALNHGQLHLRELPATTHDLSYFEGRYFLYWPPLPAVLLMPFVAIFGVHFSDILFSIGVAGLNVALVALLLRRVTERGLIDLGAVQRGILVIFFAFGTVHLTLAPYGRVWFTAQLIGFTCVVLAYLAAITMRGIPAFMCAGVAIAAAFLTRNHLVLVGLWPATYLLVQHWSHGWRRLLIYVIAGAMPVVLAIGVLGWYNFARFGSVTDNGLDYHQMAGLFQADYNQYGAFDLYYLPTNLYYQYLFYPLPFTDESYMGGSLFLLSPVFFGAFWGIFKGNTGKLPGWSIAMLTLSIVLTAVPILLLMGTGWVQWGPRYTLDFTAPLLLLTAIGVQRWPRWVLFLLTAISIMQYAVGTVYLIPMM